MVWGMTLPEGFGEFWPSGCFEYDPIRKEEGWYPRLNVYYFKQSPEVQATLGAGQIMLGDYAFYVSAKFRNEFGSREGNKPPFRVIEVHEPPRSFDTEKGYKSLGSLIMLNNSTLAVAEGLKDIIEQLEPSTHQFFPIEIRMPRGQTYPEKFYTLVVGQYFDAFSQEESKAGSATQEPSGRYRPHPHKEGLNGLAVKRSVFGNAHLWRDRSFRAELTCFSDELETAIGDANLRIPKHHKLREV